jgi:hypothetical protein
MAGIFIDRNLLQGNVMNEKGHRILQVWCLFLMQQKLTDEEKAYRISRAVSILYTQYRKGL